VLVLGVLVLGVLVLGVLVLGVLVLGVLVLGVLVLGVLVWSVVDFGLFVGEESRRHLVDLYMYVEYWMASAKEVSCA
jgi:hypothetical protein